MLKSLMSRWLLAAAAATPVAMAAGPVAPSDPAAIEAYRRLPYCRLAPDGKHLAEEPCRRPPTRSFAERRTVPAVPPQALRRGQNSAQPMHEPLQPQLLPDEPLSTAVPNTLPAHPPAAPPVPVLTLPPVPPPAVQPLNQCDAAGCRGASGTLYQPGAGNIVLDPSGRMCTRQGQWVHCQ